MEFEYTKPEYDDVEDGYEIRASREKYEFESAILLEKINEREDFAKLLKIAKPQKISEIQKISRYVRRLDRRTGTSR